MFAFLEGTIAAKAAPTVHLLVQGVGYDLEVPLSTYEKLPSPDEPCRLYTYFAVRDDHFQLYGFISEDEKQMFCMILKIRGVGARTALAILSSMSIASFVQAIQDNDLTTLCRMPGIGKKSAERMVLEMKDVLKDFSFQSSSAASYNRSSNEAISALVALGYKQSEASRIIDSVDTANLGTEQIIREALKRLARTG